MLSNSTTSKSIQEFDKLISSKKRQITSSKTNKRQLTSDLKNLMIGKQVFIAYVKSMK